MKRVIKEAVSGIVLIASFILMILFARMETDSGYYGIFVLISATAICISFYAFISYSKPGWRMVGSEDEWAVAGIMNPLTLIFRRRNDQDQSQITEKEDLEIEEDYYRNRFG